MIQNVEDSLVLNPIEDDDGLLDHGRPRQIAEYFAGVPKIHTLIIKLILESNVEDMFRNIEDSPVLNPIEDDDGLLDHGQPRQIAEYFAGVPKIHT